MRRDSDDEFVACGVGDRRVRGPAYESTNGAAHGPAQAAAFSTDAFAIAVRSESGIGTDLPAL